MIGLEGRHQWRQHKLFKLCAKPPAAQKSDLYQYNMGLAEQPQAPLSASKICDSLNSCAAHKN
jgi:hypothetical protein